jgi:hypothetical protein
MASEHYDPPFRLVHQLNSQLIAIVLGPRSPLTRLCEKQDDWIVNVIYALHADSSFGSSTVLRTSATLHSNVMYDCRKYDSLEEGTEEPPAAGLAVLSLDELVPIQSSFSGRAMLSNSPIWLGYSDLQYAGRSSRLYRPFVHVDVKVEKLPFAEIVFPICLRIGTTAIPLGVLNLEWFPQGAAFVDMDSAVSKEVVNEDMLSILDIHAAYLKLAIDCARLRICGEKEDPRAKYLLQVHEEAIQVAKNSAQQKGLGSGVN